MTDHIFIVGPGGTGKSTIGRLLAEKLEYEFCDVDLVFCDQVQLIGDFIQEHGYPAYCQRNAELIRQLLKETALPTVHAMPSGYLVHEEAPEVAEQNKRLLKDTGITILLLPSEKVGEGVDVVVQRNLSRKYLNTTAEKERRRFLSRHPKYLSYGGDIQVFSMDTPEAIAGEMLKKLVRFRGSQANPVRIS